VSLPATAAVERLAARLSTAPGHPRDRAALERLAAEAHTARKAGRPAALALRLDIFADTMDGAQLALLAALSDELPALRSPDGVTFERIASVAQLRRARSFLESL
jgi:hypothetical protein